MHDMSLTFETFQLDMSPSKRMASANMHDMSVTPEQVRDVSRVIDHVACTVKRRAHGRPRDIAPLLYGFQLGCVVQITVEVIRSKPSVMATVYVPAFLYAWL